MKNSMKKGIICVMVMSIGIFNFTSLAASYTYLKSGNDDAWVWGSANINSSVYSYGGGLTGNKYISDAGEGYFKLRRTYYNDNVIKDVKLTWANNVVSSATKIATKKDKKGLTLSVQLKGFKVKSGVIEKK